MDNQEPNDTPPSDGIWVPKDAYQQYKDQQATEIRNARSSSIMVRVFFSLLATGGLMVAVSFIGGLIAPTFTTPGRSAQCTHTSFEGVQFWLNFFGYPLLLATGIFGATINRILVRTLGIILIVVAPVVGAVMFLLALGKAFCGA